VAEALGNSGPKASAAIPDLIDLLKDKDEGVRSKAADALGAVGAAAVTELIAALKDDGTRSLVLGALGQVGAPAKAAMPQVLEALKDANKDVRVKAAWALGRIGVTPEALDR